MPRSGAQTTLTPHGPYSGHPGLHLSVQASFIKIVKTGGAYVARGSNFRSGARKWTSLFSSTTGQQYLRSFIAPRERTPPALLDIGSMSPPDYASAWLHPCRARLRFTRQVHCSSAAPCCSQLPACVIRSVQFPPVGLSRPNYPLSGISISIL